MRNWRSDPKAVAAIAYLLSVGFTAADYFEADALETGEGEPPLEAELAATETE